MSRRERKAEKKRKIFNIKLKVKKLGRVLFLLFMIINLSISIYIVEKSANEYLGEDSKDIKKQSSALK